MSEKHLRFKTLTKEDFDQLVIDRDEIEKELAELDRKTRRWNKLSPETLFTPFDTS